MKLTKKLVELYVLDMVDRVNANKGFDTNYSKGRLQLCNVYEANKAFREKGIHVLFGDAEIQVRQDGRTVATSDRMLSTRRDPCYGYRDLKPKLKWIDEIKE